MYEEIKTIHTLLSPVCKIGIFIHSAFHSTTFCLTYMLYSSLHLYQTVCNTGQVGPGYCQVGFPTENYR